MGGSVETEYMGVSGVARVTGNLDMNSTGKIVNLVNPTAAADAATKGYVDGRFVNTSISGTLDVTGTSQFRAKTIQQVSVWQESSDGKQRLFYSPNGDTYFGTGDKYIWRSSTNNSNDTDIMTLLTNGRLGIGTSSPNTALDVNGRIRAIGGIKLGPQSTTNDNMTQDSSLDINNSTNARSRFMCGNNSLTIGMSTVESFIWNESETRMTFGTANNRRMTITNDGNVGIGTSSASVALDVRGEVSLTQNLNIVLVESESKLRLLFIFDIILISSLSL